MPTNLARAALLALLLSLLAGSPAAARPAAQPAPARTAAFEGAACMFTVPDALKGKVECGYVTVPERHAAPDGPTIKLAVAIVRSTAPTPQPDPFVMLQGGPGGSTIDTYTQYLASGSLSQVRATRDIVLFDQRGTLYSKPALTCPEQLKLTEDTIERRLERAEAYRLSLDASRACRERLAASGIDLGAYNSLENAADVDAVRAALGYEKINLYGVSYGTLLALHTMREHPEGLRSVIIDAVVPPQVNFIEQVPASENRAFGELFAACAADPGCSAAYPNLEQVFFDLADQLDRQPARVPMTDPETKKTYSAVVDGDTLKSSVFQLLYASSLIPALPHVIYQMRAGDFSFFSRIMPQIIFDRTFANGMYDSVICAEDGDFRPEDVQTQGVREPLARYAEEDAQNLLDTCKLWGVPQLPASVDAPVVSDIPTLVLNGRFDPITPPSNGAEAAKTLSRSYVYTFGFTGHGAATAGQCPEAIVVQFIGDPSREPDSSCVAKQPAPELISPATVRFAPALSATLAAQDPGELAPLLVPLACLLFLMTLFFVWPLGWLIRVLGRRPAPPVPTAGHVGRAAGALAPALGLVFVVGLFVALVQLSQEGRDLVLLYGLPRAQAWLLDIPWALAAAAAVMAAAAAFAWARRVWSVPGRVYYTLLTLAAIGLAATTLPLVR